MNARCPVCRRSDVIPNVDLRIARHRDLTNVQWCPASGQPWRITREDL